MTELLKNAPQHTRLSNGGDCDCKIVPSGLSEIDCTPSATLIPMGRLADLAIASKASA